ncbi:hypothetical protein PSTG_14548 [Puccinia striiformis f. sp. tritici PST-78]|uniref:Uncharacterized protein n=1 Tax=Puccinia striiformis f. sp. tritici PST-78 TaxID=1165861 RepID=A0A0L0UYF5_9BASI|nr:hypothetical protein PSTG_14548 [Puccinia striiformis f. sp. tritici PST-78]
MSLLSSVRAREDTKQIVSGRAGLCLEGSRCNQRSKESRSVRLPQPSERTKPASPTKAMREIFTPIARESNFPQGNNHFRSPLSGVRSRMPILTFTRPLLQQVRRLLVLRQRRYHRTAIERLTQHPVHLSTSSKPISTT